MIPCVVLASTPKQGADFSEFKKEYYDFQTGTIRRALYEVTLRPFGANDGGNGGGGEPGGQAMKPMIAEHERTFWDFKYHPDGTAPNLPKYAPHMMMELCLYFHDLGHAAAFLAKHPAGRRLDTLFHYVQIVALSTPAFVGSVMDENMTDAYGAQANWIGN